jgi:hypothetical protein
VAQPQLILAEDLQDGMIVLQQGGRLMHDMSGGVGLVVARIEVEPTLGVDHAEVYTGGQDDLGRLEVAEVVATPHPVKHVGQVQVDLVDSDGTPAGGGLWFVGEPVVILVDE